MTIPWTDERDVIALHERLIAMYGGAPGLRDPALLRSALARPMQHHTYRNAAVIDLASVYTAAIVQNHPFVDGSKRVGFLTGILFLELNGYRFNASEEAAATAVIGLASGALDEGAYAAFLSANAARQRRGV